MLQWLETGVVQLAELRSSDLTEIRAILTRFESLNSQFADACLVHLAEREGIDTIFTLDRRDFSVYRTKRGKAFRLLPDRS
jgi:predicted nucleic acid-binding protein